MSTISPQTALPNSLLDSLAALGISTADVQTVPFNGSVIAKLIHGNSQPVPVILHGNTRISIEHSQPDPRDCTLIAQDPEDLSQQILAIIEAWYQ